jgi:bifunctional UDP-N-acetylglucosamine pyrophosphorylase/glucosamine-1-phosphate N-acetyltransferase
MAAGRGERMQPLSFDKQKHILKVLNKSILEYTLDQLDGLVEEVIVVIGKSKNCEAIKKLLGKRYKRIKIFYAYQKTLSGTGTAAKTALPYLKDKFLLLNGDDLYTKEDIKRVLKKFPCILVKQVKQPQFFGIVETKNGRITSFIEKPKNPKSDLANAGLFYLSKDIFDYKIKKTEREEYEFVDYIREFIKEKTLYFEKATQWMPVSYCWHLLDANKILLKNKRFFIDKGSKINKGAIIGKNVSIGKKTFIDKGVKIQDSIIGDNCKIFGPCIISDSIIGDNCKIFGPLTINNKSKTETVFTEVKGKMVDTKRGKFGVVLAEGCILNKNCIISPGVKIWPKKIIKQGSIIYKDVK